MSKHLVIVESPAKAKTIQKYLGNDYEVVASYGHVRDLPARKGSVNPENHFAMTYAPIEKNARHIETIAKMLKKSDSLLLATDPDREGEAISWHIYELMKEKNLTKDKPIHRIFSMKLRNQPFKRLSIILVPFLWISSTRSKRDVL